MVKTQKELLKSQLDCSKTYGPYMGLRYTYLLLKRTLYGLKRSPWHWYVTCKKALIQLGLQPFPNAPCIFYGTIIEGKPSLYLSLCVDDFIFFSESSHVKTTFQQKFSNVYKADFQNEVSYFLGVDFHITKHDDSHLDIFMNQPIDVQNLLTKCNLNDTNPVSTPYWRGHPVDSIPRTK